jgi:hypothetical protein
MPHRITERVSLPRCLGILVCAAIVALSQSSTVFARNVTATSCSQSDVQAAINSAVDGDTVVIPAGSCTWTRTVVVGNVDTHAGVILTLQGAGIDQTVITHAVDPNAALTYPFLSNALSFNSKDGGVSRITGITWRGGGLNDPYNKGMVTIVGPSSQFRVDHCKFVPNGTYALGFDGYVRGVVDHNTFDVSAGHGYGMYIHHGSWNNQGGYGDTSWASADSFGTAQAMYVEDNTFTNNQSNVLWYFANDGWSGGRVVYRYNVYANTVWTNHGTETGGRWRSQRQYEVYNNTFSLTNGAGVSTLVGSRGGTGVVYNNTATLTNGAFINQFADLSDYRASTAYAPWGACNGTNIWDGNSDGSGYPCLDQPGRGRGNQLSGTDPTPRAWPQQESSPVYAWNNTINGTLAGLVSLTGVVVANRDFFNSAKPGYTAYQYPHPLVTSSSSTSLPAPTGLQVTP